MKRTTRECLVVRRKVLADVAPRCIELEQERLGKAEGLEPCVSIRASTHRVLLHHALEVIGVDNHDALILSDLILIRRRKYGLPTARERYAAFHWHRGQQCKENDKDCSPGHRRRQQYIARTLARRSRGTAAAPGSAFSP